MVQGKSQICTIDTLNVTERPKRSRLQGEP